MSTKRIALGLIPVLFAVAAGPALAEEASAVDTPFRTGALVGINLSSFSGDGIDPARTHEAKVGPAAGAFLGYRIGRGWSAEVQALLSAKGAGLSAPGGEGTANFHYLEFPVLAVRAFEVDLPVVPFAYGGLSLNLLVGADARDSSGARDPLGDATRTVDVGFVLGGGVAWPATGRARFLLGLRVHAGLRKFLEDGAGEPIDARHSVLSVLAGLEL